MNKYAIAFLLSSFIVAPAFAAGTPYYIGVNVGSAKIDYPNFDSTTSIALLGG